MCDFIKGIDLCESFFHEIAKPILASAFPSLRYSAGLIGYSSDVLGYDDAISTDHMWGSRFLLFLPADDFEATKASVGAVFSSRFPYQYKGYSVHFSPPDAQDCGRKSNQERLIL